MRWMEVQSRFDYWLHFLGIPFDAIKLFKPKEFNSKFRPRLCKKDWGRCNYEGKAITLAPARMSKRNLDVTLLHEICHLIYPAIVNDTWIDNRAETIAGYEREKVIAATRRHAKRLAL